MLENNLSIYPKVKKILGNTRSYISTLLPDPNPTRYPIFCPLPDLTQPDIEKPNPLGTGRGRSRTREKSECLDVFAEAAVSIIDKAESDDGKAVSSCQACHLIILTGQR